MDRLWRAARRAGHFGHFSLHALGFLVQDVGVPMLVMPDRLVKRAA